MAIFFARNSLCKCLMCAKKYKDPITPQIIDLDGNEWLYEYGHGDDPVPQDEESLADPLIGKREWHDQLKFDAEIIHTSMCNECGQRCCIGQEDTCDICLTAGAMRELIWAPTVHQVKVAGLIKALLGSDALDIIATQRQLFSMTDLEIWIADREYSDLIEEIYGMLDDFRSEVWRHFKLVPTKDLIPLNRRALGWADAILTLPDEIQTMVAYGFHFDEWLRSESRRRVLPVFRSGVKAIDGEFGTDLYGAQFEARKTHTSSIWSIYTLACAVSEIPCVQTDPTIKALLSDNWSALWSE